jgi:hypothetical protein
VVAIGAALIFRGSDAQPVAQASASVEPSPAASSPSYLERASPTEIPTGGSATPLATVTPATAEPTAAATQKPVTCKPTDQDRYVYHPYRLAVQGACIRVTGVIQAVRQEADGDFHILLALDPEYAYLLTPANQGVELGDLVVEPICVRSVTQTDAIAICASDPDPLPPPYPTVGQRVWMEGRYVFDLEHGGWAELHPLYRWGAN